jgi:hypothetical protein
MIDYFRVMMKTVRLRGRRLNRIVVESASSPSDHFKGTVVGYFVLWFYSTIDPF